MAAKAALGKIGKVDFFACLPSGTYAFISLYLAFSMEIGVDTNGHSLWFEINKLIENTSQKPTSLLLIMFCSYLLGSVLRAIPVSFTERIVHGD